MSRHRRSVYLDDEQWSALASVAEAEDRSVNGVVRLAVAAYLGTQIVMTPAEQASLRQRFHDEFHDVPRRDCPLCAV